MQALKDRIAKVKKVAHRAQQLAQLGLSAVEYVRGAAVPAMLYGCEVSGISDSMLDDAVGVAAKSLSPPTAGKNPVLVLHAAAVHSAAINPVVMANLAPIKTWSTAWWEKWACADTMSRTYVKCSDRVHKAGANPWSAVHGPAAALAATCKRLKWRSVDGKIFYDDVGAMLDVALDPPYAFEAAARRSAIRLCTDHVMEQLPSALPTAVDIHHHSGFGARNEREGGRRTLLVDLMPFLKPLHRGSKRVTAKLPQWSAKCRGYLASAINGGQ